MQRINKNQIAINIYREHFDASEWFRAHLAMLQGSYALRGVKTPDQVEDEQAAEEAKAIIKRTKGVPYVSRGRTIKKKMKEAAGSRRQYIKGRKMLARLTKEKTNA